MLSRVQLDAREQMLDNLGEVACRVVWWVPRRAEASMLLVVRVDSHPHRTSQREMRDHKIE